jgi:hypothetical protein
METWMIGQGESIPPAWEACSRHMPADRRDVYYLPGYCASWLGWEGGKAVALWDEFDGVEYLYCVLLKELPYHVDTHWRYDAQSFYGYGGIQSSGLPVPEHLERFNDALDAWMHEQGVVVEFIRQHPLLHPTPAYARRGDFVVVRTNVYAENPARVRDRLDATTRRNIAKAIRSGVRIERWDSERGAAPFAQLYHRTAERLGMDAFYWFPENYFRSVAKYLGAHTEYLVAVLDGMPIAAVMLLAEGETLTYHLGASDERFWHLRPNDVLFATMLEYAARRGYRLVSLGGGTTADPEDSLYRYKRKFGNRHEPVYVGKRIHAPDVYDQLCAMWEREHPDRIHQGRGYVLRYRIGEFDHKVTAS